MSTQPNLIKNGKKISNTAPHQVNVLKRLKSFHFKGKPFICPFFVIINKTSLAAITLKLEKKEILNCLVNYHNYRQSKGSLLRTINNGSVTPQHFKRTYGETSISEKKKISTTTES